MVNCAHVRSAVSTLDYASPQTKGDSLRVVIDFFVSAAVGFAVNLGFIALSIWSLHRSAWAYHDLTQNPHAYGRDVAPRTIALLRQPFTLWISELVFALAAAFGALLALHLFIAALQRHSRPDQSLRRFQEYRFWKPIGTFMTAAAFYWSTTEDNHFWNAATRHIPIGSGPPVLSTIMLIICGLLPAWWISRRLRIE